MQLVTGVAVGGGLGAVAAPWWAWAVVLPGLWLLAAAMRRMTPSYLVTRCSG
ncbi:hypothetical protein Q5530_11840 [Saccharothrix sp. BKS2]|uniref:hypothetical protein n=1 Tax=Saccharothrix sp. BKS2 TaxID=3064400 RepID=UPI0039EA5FE9